MILSLRVFGKIKWNDKCVLVLCPRCNRQVALASWRGQPCRMSPSLHASNNLGWETCLYLLVAAALIAVINTAVLPSWALYSTHFIYAKTSGSERISGPNSRGRTEWQICLVFKVKINQEGNFAFIVSRQVSKPSTQTTHLELGPSESEQGGLVTVGDEKRERKHKLSDISGKQAHDTKYV